MTKTVPVTLLTDIGLKTSTLSTQWRIARTDGQEFFFTNHDLDLEIPAGSGDVYETASGYVPTAIDANEQLAVDNLEASGFLETDKIDADDLRAGLYDGAEIDIFVVNWNDVPAGQLFLAKGWTIGNVTVRDNDFIAELRGLSEHLQREILELISPTCRANHGDGRCGIDLDDSAGTYRYEGSVTGFPAAPDVVRRKFIDSGVDSSIATDVFRRGTIEWTTTSSANYGLKQDIKSFDPVTGQFTLLLPVPFDIETGDTFTAKWGCDLKFATCRDTYSNGNNFRGEPFVPGWDRTLRINVP